MTSPSHEQQPGYQVFKLPLPLHTLNAASPEEALERLAEHLGCIVFYDTPQMPVEAVHLIKGMLDLASIQIQVQLQARGRKPDAAPPPTPAPERRKRGRRPSRASASNGTNGTHPPVSAASPDEPSMFDHPAPGPAS